MKTSTRIVLIALAALTATTARATSDYLRTDMSPQEKGRAIALEQDRRDAGYGDTSASLEMVLMDQHGRQASRRLRNKVLEGTSGDGDKNLIVFDEPRDIKGSAFLTRAQTTQPDEQWIYMPSTNRVKRISSKKRSGPFFGSEFANEDMAPRVIDKYTYRFIEEADYNGTHCYVVESMPKDKHSGYSRIVSWIDSEELRVMKSVFYDRRKKSVLKTLTVSGYELYQDRHWRPAELVMENSQTGKSTRLVFSDYAFGVGLDDKHFSNARLNNAR